MHAMASLSVTRKLQVLPQIGRGHFADGVYKFTLAAKVVKRNDPDCSSSSSKRAEQMLLEEIEKLKVLRHERIIPYCFSRITENTVTLFMELMEGSIADLIKHSDPLRISANRIKKYTRQILEGLVYLHEENIVHRDIKATNVLLDNSDNVKLADFGLAIQLSDVSEVATTFHGAIGWFAPETLVPYYRFPNDIWSVGCTIVEMLTGRSPNYYWPCSRSCCMTLPTERYVMQPSIQEIPIPVNMYRYQPTAGTPLGLVMESFDVPVPMPIFVNNRDSGSISLQDCNSPAGQQIEIPVNQPPIGPQHGYQLPQVQIFRYLSFVGDQYQLYQRERFLIVYYQLLADVSPSSDIVAILSNCLQPSPQLRQTAQDLLLLLS